MASPNNPRYSLPLPVGTLTGLIVAVLSVLVVALVSYRSLQSRTEAFNLVTHTLEVIQQLEMIGSTAKDVETGQRGFLLTGNNEHLDIYNRGRSELPGMLAHVTSLVSDNPAQTDKAQRLRQLVEMRVEVAEQTLVLKRAGDDAGAMGLMTSGKGLAAMRAIRDLIAEMTDVERRLLEARQVAWERAARGSTFVAWLGSASLIVLIGIAAVLLSRDFRSREALSWLRQGQAELGARIQGEQRVETLGTEVINFLARYLEAPVGAVYIADATGEFRRIAGFAIADESLAGRVDPGIGLAGQAAKENRTVRITDVPADYLMVSSTLGRRSPVEVLVAPASVDGEVQAIIELGFFRRVAAVDMELMTNVSEMLAVAVRSSKDRSRLEELLAETQQQAEELQTQQEELRVNNEELEEQSRVLKESQSRLEQQQAELEQINAHLEEQTHLLEAQRADLAQTQVVLTDKAAELEKANHYKSEFLANMSHELRTPLNSSLILATLLADNREGNLTEEQVQFARTIYEAGNDLLALINDILDLSKIESGKVELTVEPVALSTTVDSLDKTFEPLAGQKGLRFSSEIDPAVPMTITSDAQRLGQVLKNLLSNAIKFTEQGSVSLRVSPGPGNTIRFAVQDTGIGIQHGQQDIIFEAFRQADGSTHRKYGGTGLGLSISRDLARLLGGDIAVSSEPGRGSTFTLTLPAVYAGPVTASTAPAPPSAPPAIERRAPQPKPVGASALTPSAIGDDRDQLAGSTRRILIVEDDVAFSKILRDLAREKGFRAIVTHTAADGVTAATTLAPSAIVLDVNLPDHSGLGVLDQLKRNPRTRHIPVHVVSVADYAQQALERGAVGYALKPITRDDLSEALSKLESKLAQGVRRVLVVEDDARQRASIAQLLGAPDVEITGVSTAAEALTALGATTFDCVVMDLKLPDVSGYELLEQMAANDRASFPPVIVYTGRSLTAAEEQRLRKFSRSIIIKDARSPERLLDEVTLFLHQVESTLPLERQQMLQAARNRDTALENRRILVVEDDVRNIFALSRVLEPRGATVEIARNGREALTALERAGAPGGAPIDLVLMDIMMPEMDGITAMQEIRKRPDWKRLPIIALTAKAMKDDQEKCLAAGANDYMAKPFDVEKLLSLVRVWMPK